MDQALFDLGDRTRRAVLGDHHVVLLQTAVYCGMPAALDSFRITREVLEEAHPG